jgi:hypothetical protein
LSSYGPNVNVNVQAVAACGPCLSLTPSHSSANLHRRLSETRCPSHVRLARCGVPACWDTDPEGRCASASSSDLNLSSFRRPVVAPTSADMLLCRYLWCCRVRAEVSTAPSSRPYNVMGARASRVSSCHLQHSHPCMDSPSRGGARCDYGSARRLTGCQTHECLMDPSLAYRRGIHVLSLLETASFAATVSPLLSLSLYSRSRSINWFWNLLCFLRPSVALYPCFCSFSVSISSSTQSIPYPLLFNVPHFSHTRTLDACFSTALDYLLSLNYHDERYAPTRPGAIRSFYKTGYHFRAPRRIHIR